MTDVTLTPSGPPETILPDPEPDVLDRLDRAAGADELAAVVADHPASLDAWAALGELLESDGGMHAVMAYAAYRVGYHRGLDALRRHGWRGSGYVRWSNPSNRGFLRCLDGLGRMAGVIGEIEEATRCAEFLRMLDPDWDRRSE